MGFKEERPLGLYLIPHGTLSGGLRYFPRPESHEISLENLLILKIHNEDMKLIVDAILRRSH